MRELELGPDRALKIVANPSKKFYVLKYIEGYAEYYAVLPYCNMYCLQMIKKSDIKDYGGPYHKAKSIQEVLENAIQYPTQSPDRWALYEFESIQEFLDSII